MRPAGWLSPQEHAASLREQAYERQWSQGVRVVLDFGWPRDRFAEALERALKDGVFTDATATSSRRPPTLDERLDELGFD